MSAHDGRASPLGDAVGPRRHRARQYKFVQADQVFPKKVWYKASGQVWFGYCINTQSGEYKGWPISEEERDAVFGRVG